MSGPLTPPAVKCAERLLRECLWQWIIWHDPRDSHQRIPYGSGALWLVARAGVRGCGVMPAIFAQHGLRQNAPADKQVKAEPERSPRRGRVMSDKTKRLIVLWGDLSKSAEEIAAELGYSNVQAAYQVANYYNLPYRPVRPRKGTT